MKKATAILLMTLMVSMAPASACKMDNILDPVKSILGIAIGAPVGAVAGLLRGATAKGVDYSKSFPDELGGGHVGTLLGTPIGFVTGVATGGVNGVLNGLVKGIRTGISAPLSKERMSITGDFIDYDPYDFD